MATIVYLHGFLSAGTSKKSNDLRKALPEHTVISPDLPLDPLGVISLVKDIMQSVDSYPVVFVGTSLGGFYANYFGQKYDCNTVLVNPATSPSTVLIPAIGEVTNYKTGVTEEFTFNYVNRLYLMEQDIAEIYNGILTNLFVALDDDVISADATLDHFKFTNDTKIYKDGGHRFTMHWDDVIKCTQELVT